MRDAVFDLCSVCQFGFECAPSASVSQESAIAKGAGARWKIVVRGRCAGLPTCAVANLQGGTLLKC